MGTKENFFIKEGYQTNPVATFESEPGEYWTEKRIATTKLFQHYVYARAAKLFQANRFKTVADIGCGPAYKTRFFFQDISENITLIDQPTLKPVIDRFFPEANFVGIDLDNEQLKGGLKFDMVICSDVIEHLADPTNLLEIIKHVLNPGGIAIVSTPERDFRRGKQCMDSPNPQHVREWNKEEFKSLLEHHKFQVIDQKFDPQKIVSTGEYWISRALSPLYRRPKWSACQTAILTHK